MMIVLKLLSVFNDFLGVRHLTAVRVISSHDVIYIPGVSPKCKPQLHADQLLLDTKNKTEALQAALFEPNTELSETHNPMRWSPSISCVPENS